jgi:hypothetical protein
VELAESHSNMFVHLQTRLVPFLSEDQQREYVVHIAQPAGYRDAFTSKFLELFNMEGEIVQPILRPFFSSLRSPVNLTQRR